MTSLSLRPPGSTPVHRVTFSSDDEDEVAGFFLETYPEHRLRLACDRDRAATVDLTAATCPGLASVVLRSSIGFSVDATHPTSTCVFSVVRAGHLRLRRDGREVVVGPGHAVLFPLEPPLHVEASALSTRSVQLSLASLEQVAEEVAGTPPGALRFEGMTATSPAMDAYFRSVVALASGALLAPDPPMASPLVAQEMTRTLAVAALHAFTNTTMTCHHRTGPGATGPSALRRAVAHIEAHAHEPVQLSDIAAAAGTSPRALQYAFTRHLDTTPLGHLRRVRLQRAHADLQAADPSRGDTVAAVARRWGFTNAGRFATAYQRAFGRLPRETLDS